MPLHSGSTPKWLFKRMVNLAKPISDIIISEYGNENLLKRLSDPYWFQALSCILGYDHHSSGCTTVTLGALKLVLNTKESNIAIAGGKGTASKKTLKELEIIGNKFSLSSSKIEKLKYTSKIVAKVDNSLIQSGFSLYHHSFVVTEGGKWVVIQQGLNSEIKYARRYHWIHNNVNSFVEEPHKAICCDIKVEGLNMVAKESKETRDISLDIVKDNPKHLSKYFRLSHQTMLGQFLDFNNIDVLDMHRDHKILPIDISKRSWNTLRKIYEFQPKNYEELISLHGVGEKTVRSLALISELIYGSKPSWKDPAKFSFCVGGKDKIPYEINKNHYDDVIASLREIIQSAKLEKKDKLNALNKLSMLINN